MDRFEWDPEKAAQNVYKHGIDFTTASRVWGGLVFERVDNRQDYGEVRLQAFGLVGDVCSYRCLHLARDSSPHNLGQKGQCP
jgi:uncharacterized DUF497 family protein